MGRVNIQLPCFPPASELTVFLSQLARVVAEKEGAVLRGFSPQAGLGDAGRRTGERKEVT